MRRRLDELEQRVVLAQNRNDRLEERIIALESALGPDGAPGPGPAEAAGRSAGSEPADLPVVMLRPEARAERDPPEDLASKSAIEPEQQPPSEFPAASPETSDDPDTPPPTLIKIHGSAQQPGERPAKARPERKTPASKPESPVGYRKMVPGREASCAG
jgi:hypothetical protein